MSILFDLSATQSGSSAYTGGNEYAKAVFLNLAGRAPDHVVAFSEPGRPIDPVIENAASQVEHVRATWGDDVQRLIDREDVSTFYSALPPTDVTRLNLRSVHWRFTLHGLRPYELPTDAAERWFAKDLRSWMVALTKATATDWYRRRILSYYRRLLSIPARSTRVFVPSEHTKYTLLAAHPEVDSDEVEVVFSPPKPVEEREHSREEVAGLLRNLGVEPQKYVLLISGDRWLKNALRAVRALDRLYSRHPSVQLRTLVVGVSDQRPYARHLSVPGRTVFSPYVTPVELEMLYANAFALLYPTLNEGFGYPPLECMRHGVPAICGAVASVPEVCGDAVLYVDPRSDSEMQARVLQLYRNPDLWDDIAERGRRRAADVRARQRSTLDTLTASLLDADGF